MVVMGACLMLEQKSHNILVLASTMSSMEVCEYICIHHVRSQKSRKYLKTGSRKLKGLNTYIGSQKAKHARQHIHPGTLS
jgi:hypothetical protein